MTNDPQIASRHHKFLAVAISTGELELRISSRKSTEKSTGQKQSITN